MEEINEQSDIKVLISTIQNLNRQLKEEQEKNTSLIHEVKQLKDHLQAVV